MLASENGRPHVAHPPVGLVEWFEVGEHDRVERVLDELRALGVEHLRTGVSWADWHAPGGRRWYDWLLPRLAREVEVVPCVVYTPPSLGIEPRSSSPPRRTRDYADFLDLLISQHGDAFEFVELWNEPNNIAEWDWRLDLEWNLFAQMIGESAHWVRQRGRKSVLGGMSPLDKNWLSLMAEKGALTHIDVVGIHGFPGTWEVFWEGWEHVVLTVRDVLDWHALDCAIWITEAGFSTWRNDEFSQVREFLDALRAPVERVYWYSAEDLDADRAAIGGFHTDVRHYHTGVHGIDGQPKLLARLWEEGGIDGVRRVAALAGPERRPRRAAPLALVSGGAGFIGTNVAERLLDDGYRVRVFDNLSRPGVERNLQWLRERHDERLSVVIGDVRDAVAVREAANGIDLAVHLAAQVAVTTSLERPRDDFDVNARGTINLLEELRRAGNRPPLLFTSTNKVYGALAALELVREGDRWQPLDALVQETGIDEERPLDFCTPYGCSKGAADQYVLDYAKSYDLPALVFRMSCIYGPHQHGTEDQGWVAHFLLQALRGRPITIYGDGAQVRDVLFVDDLVDAIMLGLGEAEALAGAAFNMGGGPANAVSLLEVIDLIAELHGRRPQIAFARERPGDQRYYVSNTSRFEEATDWTPQVGVRDGVETLYRWLSTRTKARLRATA